MVSMASRRCCVSLGTEKQGIRRLEDDGGAPAPAGGYLRSLGRPWAILKGKFIIRRQGTTSNLVIDHARGLVDLSAAWVLFTHPQRVEWLPVGHLQAGRELLSPAACLTCSVLAGGTVCQAQALVVFWSLVRAATFRGS